MISTATTCSNTRQLQIDSFRRSMQSIHRTSKPSSSISPPSSRRPPRRATVVDERPRLKPILRRGSSMVSEINNNDESTSRRNSVTFSIPSQTSENNLADYFKAADPSCFPSSFSSFNNNNPSSLPMDKTERDSQYYKYQLGETLKSSSHILMNDDNYYNEADALEAISSMKKYDFAFVKRSNGEFTYAIVASSSISKKTMGRDDADSNEEDYLFFVTDREGHSKKVKRRHWLNCIRPVNYACVQRGSVKKTPIARRASAA